MLTSTSRFDCTRRTCDLLSIIWWSAGRARHCCRTGSLWTCCWRKANPRSRRFKTQTSNCLRFPASATGTRLCASSCLGFCSLATGLTRAVLASNSGCLASGCRSVCSTSKSHHRSNFLHGRLALNALAIHRISLPVWLARPTVKPIYLSRTFSWV